MKIENSVVAMSSYRTYEAEAKETQSTITRSYQGGELQRASVHAKKVGISQFEAEGGSAVYTTSSAGVSRKDQAAQIITTATLSRLKMRRRRSNLFRSSLLQTLAREIGFTIQFRRQTTAQNCKC